MVIPDTIGGLPVTTIRYDAFSDCTGLTSVTIGNGVSSIGEQAFSGCTGLTAITVDALNPVSGSLGSGSSSTRAKLRSRCFRRAEPEPTRFPKASRAWALRAFGLHEPHQHHDPRQRHEHRCWCFVPAEAVQRHDSRRSHRLGGNVFSGCTSLTSVGIPDGVTRIGDSAFYGCRSLSSVTIPDGVTRIGDSAFYGCRSLSSVTIPNSVRSIGWDSFSLCSSLTNVVIGNGLVLLGSRAFERCARLRAAYFEGNAPCWSTQVMEAAMWEMFHSRLSMRPS